MFDDLEQSIKIWNKNHLWIYYYSNNIYLSISTVIESKFYACSNTVNTSWYIEWNMVMMYDKIQILSHIWILYTEESPGNLVRGVKV